MVDLKELEGVSAKHLDDGVDVAIRHPVTGEEIGMTIRVASYDSERVRQARLRVSRPLERRLNGKKPTIEDTEVLVKAILAGSVISWEGVERDGDKLACNAMNVAALFEQFPWIAKQIDEVAQDNQRFFKS